MYSASLSRIAGGTIQPFSFVVADPGVQQGCLAATGADQQVLGIADKSTDIMPGLKNAPTVLPAATDGEALRIFSDGEEALLRIGSGYSVNPDTDLVADASGYGIPLDATNTTSVQWIGARSVEGGQAEEVIRVIVRNIPYSGL